MELLGGKQRETVGQIKTHLITENRTCAGTGAVVAVDTFSKYGIEQIEILFHGDMGRVRG